MNHIMRNPGLRTSALLAVSAAASCIFSICATEALAKGGTAKPPDTPATPQVVIMPPAGPVLGAPGSLANGFDITGFVQRVFVAGGCGAANPQAGGTLFVNNMSIRIPRNMIVQFPANTTTWKDAVCGISNVQAALALNNSGTTAAAPIIFPSVEVSVVGNLVEANGGDPAANPATSQYMAALITVSQESLNGGSGYIKRIDYSTGHIFVHNGAGDEIEIIINDPDGRFGRANASTDARFSVDSENPTIKAAETGYPMCVPRDKAPDGSDIPKVNVLGVEVPDDPLCPARNRPISDGGGACRTFLAAGFTPVGGDIVTTPAGSACRAFVMKAVAGMPGTAAFLAGDARLMGPTDPDPRQQVPFLPGDFINWSGTFVPDPNFPNNRSRGLIWAHTIDANLGIYTQPATLPAYVAIGEFGIGVEPNPNPAVAGVESTDRIFLEASTTDIASTVDIYLDDKGFKLDPTKQNPLNPDDNLGPIVPARGAEYFRWVTTESMTGTLTDQIANPGLYATTVEPFGGGIQTQFVGPVPGRARIRANKVPAIDPTQVICLPTGGSRGCAVTQSPTRYMRAVLRSLCAPEGTGKNGNNGAAVPATNLDNTAWHSINGTRPALPGSGNAGTPTCLESANFANGLNTGQYMAPVGEFIFPEPTLAGTPILPNNFWQMGFLVYGEGGAPNSGDSSNPLRPQPW